MGSSKDVTHTIPAAVDEGEASGEVAEVGVEAEEHST